MWTFALAVLIQEKALPKIAEVTSASGSVEIVGSTGPARKPARFGTRWKNAEVRDEDRIKTGEGSQAVILFPDASKVTLKEKSEIQVLQKTLPKPTPEGNTVGRRLKLVVGSLVSEVVPNKDVRTDFETVAGAAAVRGTRLELAAAGRSVTLSTTDGLVRFINGEFSVRVDVGHGQAIRATRGSVTIEILDDGGRTLTGEIGDRDVTFTDGDNVKVETSGPNVTVDVQEGSVEVDGQETTGDFECPENEAIGEDTSNFDPEAETGGEMPEEDPAPVEEMFDESAMGEEPGASDLIDEATDVGTSGSGIVEYFDDFERPDDLVIGNGWIEVMELGGLPVDDTAGLHTLGLSGGSALLYYCGGASSLEGFLAQDVGFFATFEAEATFTYTGAVDFVALAMNYDTALDVGVALEFFPSTGLVEMEHALGTLFSDPSGPTFGPGTPFTLNLTYDGALLCGSIFDGGGGLVYNH